MLCYHGYGSDGPDESDMSSGFRERKTKLFKNIACDTKCWYHPCVDPEGDRGSGHPLKKYKNIGFPSNTAPDHLKITKLPSQHSMMRHHQHASETPFKWRLAGGPMMAQL